MEDKENIDTPLYFPNFRYDPHYLQKRDMAANYTVTAEAIKITDVSLIPDTPADITNAIRKEIRNG